MPPSGASSQPTLEEARFRVEPRRDLADASHVKMQVPLPETAVVHPGLPLGIQIMGPLVSDEVCAAARDVKAEAAATRCRARGGKGFVSWVSIASCRWRPQRSPVRRPATSAGGSGPYAAALGNPHQLLKSSQMRRRAVVRSWKEAALPSFVHIPRVACPVRTNRLAPRPSVFLALTRKTKGRSTQAGSIQPHCAQSTRSAWSSAAWAPWQARPRPPAA